MSGESVGYLSSYFFFQAEDGIRDTSVTGVQTCALPIFVTFFCSGGGIMAIAVGQPAPDFTLKDQNQKDVKLSQYRGKNEIGRASCRERVEITEGSGS